MYVAKFVRRGIIIRATLFQKVWVDEMNSHQIEEITHKNFIFRFSAIHWLDREITRILFEQHQLEIIDG